MSKKLLILFLVLTIIGFSFIPASAVDFPHNEQSMIGCDSCHDVFGGAEDLMLTWVTYGANIDDTQSNAVCWSCHNDVEAPYMKTHSSLQIDNGYGDWTVQCKVCHWPHDQQNLSYGPAYYRTSGNSTNLTTAALTDTSKSWTTNEFQGMLLIPNLNQETSEGNLFMYRIKSNDATSITVEDGVGDPPIDLAKASSGNPYAVIYGKLVRDSINVAEITGQGTPQTGERAVRFYINQGANSFADGVAPFDGVCEVCHVETQKIPVEVPAVPRFRYNEHADTHNESTDCTVCHVHLDGMSPSGACDICHGYPPIENVANSSSTGGNTGLVDSPGTTGSLHAGKHDFHVNTMAYGDCNFCHYNSAGSGPTHNTALVEEITLGFSLFTGTWQGGAYDGQTAAQVPSGYNTTATIPPTSVTATGNRTCTNIYCHSIVQTNGGGALSFGNAAHWQSPPPVWDTASGSITCGSCHLNPPLTGRHTNKHLSDYAATFDCSTCHMGGGYKRTDGPDTLHANADIDVFVNNITSKDSSTDYGTATYTGTPVAQDGYGNCENLYCHSDGQLPTPTYANLAWDTSSTLDCTGCHNHEAGASAEMVSGAHNTHINDSDNEVGRDLGCVTCHEATVSDNTTISDFTKHVNKIKNIDINVGTETTCTDISCHSDGNFDGTLTHNNPVWNPSDTLGCVNCHGDGGTQAYPSYADGNSGTGDANSHEKHAGTANSNIDCEQCHNATSTVGTSIDGATPSLHVNQVVDVVLKQGGTYNEINPANGDADDTCSATYCHGAGKSPAWGNTAAGLNCDSCHSGSGTNLPDSHTLHYGSGAVVATGSDFTPNNNSSHPNYIYTCGVCHDGTTHAGGSVSGIQAAEISFNAAIAGGSASYTPDIVAAGSDKGFSYTAGSCGTVYCHSNAQASPSYVTPTWGGSNPTPATCTWCHNNDNASGATMASGSHLTHVDDSDNEVGRDLPCITCHESTVASDNRTISDTSFHVNMTKDININIGAETDCTNIACHSNGNLDGGTVVYNNPTWGVTVLGCTNCHGDGGTKAYPTYANGGVGNDSNSHEIHAGTANNIACGECHDATSTVGTSIDGTTPSLHVNQIANVVLDTGAYNTGNETCNNTLCHGGTQQWGTVFAAGTDTCTKCHGTPSAAPATDAQIAPPVDTDGDSSAANEEVGAHQAHILLSSNYTDVLNTVSNCEECHTKPATVNAAGHIDTVRPAEVLQDSNQTYQKANLNSVTPTYTYAGNTCSVYCHGVNMPLSGAGGGGSDTTPDWKNTAYLSGTPSDNDDGTGDCEKCHDAPPAAVVAHTGTEGLSGAGGADSCNDCHLHFNDGGSLNDKSQHIDGIVQAVADCDGCHGYPPTPGDAFGYQAVEGKGAHQTHVDHIEALYIAGGGSALDAANDTFGTGAPGAICGTCHTKNSANHQTGDRVINFGDGAEVSVGIDLNFGASAPNYNGIVGTPGATQAKTCSNLSCHFTNTPEWEVWP